MLAVLPPAARVVFADNPSVDTRGLEGMATVEYRVLVPTRKGGVIIGERGSVGHLAGVWGRCGGGALRGQLRAATRVCACVNSCGCVYTYALVNLMTDS
jgi:hypothetical protein